MSLLLFIAQITRFYKLRRWCAIKRYRQYEAKWAKEKATVRAAAVSNFDEIGW